MIQVIHRAFDIIDYVSNDPERPKHLGIMAKDLGLNAGTCANIIKTIVKRGYVEKSESHKGYLPGKRMNFISSNTVYKQELIDVSEDEMLKLSKKLQENVLIAILKGDSRMVVQQHIYKQMVQAVIEEEKKAYDSVSGRVLIAYQTDEFQTKFILRHGLPATNIWNEASTQKKFNASVKKIKEDGYAIIESAGQLFGIAAPILKQGTLVAAIGVYIPEYRMDEEKKQKLITMILKSSSTISANFG